MLNNITCRAIDIDEAFLYWYNLLSKMNDSLDSRCGGVKGEVINAVTVIENPTKCIMKNEVRNLSYKYMIGEMLWYILAENTYEGSIDKFSSYWKKISNEDGTVNSNYGWCIKSKYGFDQLKYIIELLKKDQSSRQAVIHIKEPRNIFDNPTNDVNCTVCLQFIIRENKLYMTTYMRSNDLWLGFPYDIFNFTALQIYLSMALKVELGTYTHIAGSLHLYEKDAKG